MDGDYRVLYAVWEKYGGYNDDEEFEIPVLIERKSGKDIIKQFMSILE